MVVFCFFFFQAEDGIRDLTVTGVQTCALPIWEDGRFGVPETFVTNANLGTWTEYLDRLAYYRGHRDGRRVREMLGIGRERSEERRVGKECRSRGSAYQ